MRKPSRHVALAGALLVMLAGRSEAQREVRSSAASSHRVAGIVVDSAGSAVAFADVRLRDAEGRQRVGATDEGGRFSLTGLPAGPAQLEVRRLGYRPYAQPLVVPETDAPGAGTRIVLAAAAAQLTGIEISDSRDESDPALAGFYARR